MNKAVIQHVLSRLHDMGVTDVFGVPGDYAFPVNDAICNDPKMRWIGCCNELNAAYAADGYARIKGAAALCTTYGVGELSAVNGVAGAYAEHLAVFHLVGTPNISTQVARALMHHTLGNGEYDLFRRMAEPVVCGHAVMTPQNVAYETERLIAEALYHHRPVYMAFPADLANQAMLGEASPIAKPLSNPVMLTAAADAIVAALGKSHYRVHYAALAKAFGNDDWMTARVTTCEELDEAMDTAAKADTGAYIEVVTDAYAAPPLAMKLHDAVKTLYKS